MIEVPSMKFDILVGLASIRGKLMLVERLGRSRPRPAISRLEGFGSFLSLLTPAGRAGRFSLPASTRCDPPGGGFGSMRPVPPQYRALRSATGVRRACRDSDLQKVK